MIYANFTSLTVVNIWNSLPSHVVSATSSLLIVVWINSGITKI